jgi:hypothetical protein
MGSVISDCRFHKKYPINMNLVSLIILDLTANVGDKDQFLKLLMHCNDVLGTFKDQLEFS